MEEIFTRYNIISNKQDNKKNIDYYISKLFQDDINILDIYITFRSENILLETNINKLLKKFEEYIKKQILSDDNLAQIIYKIIDKLDNIKELFNYMNNKNKIENKFFYSLYDIIFLNFEILKFKIIDFYNNNNIDNKFIKYIIFIVNILRDIEISYYQLLLDKIIILIYENYLIKDNNLIEKYNIINNIKHFSTLKNELNNNIQNNIQNNKLFDYLIINLIKKLPLIEFINQIDIINTNNFYFDIIKDCLQYNIFYNDIILNITKNINILNSYIHINTEKYKSEKLLIEIYKIFKIFKIIIDSFYFDDMILNIISLSITNFIEQEKNLIDYICYGLLIFAKKLNNDNYKYLNNIIFVISNCISYSSINYSFQYTFYKYLKLYNLSNININYLPKYLINLIHENNRINIHDNNNNENIIKIKKYISEIERNIRHNIELKQVKISTNISDIEYNFNKCSFLLLEKNEKISFESEIIIPNELLIYYKTIESFYHIKFPYKKINWIYDNCKIILNYNNYTISGSLIPILILFVINKFNVLTQDELYKKLILNITSDNCEYINKYIQILLDINLITFINLEYKLNIINKDYNIDFNNIINKTENNNNNHYDINNTIDCYIIKILKPLIHGIYINDLLIELNKINIHFKINIEQLQERISFLINKYYILQDGLLIKYDP